MTFPRGDLPVLDTLIRVPVSRIEESPQTRRYAAYTALVPLVGLPTAGQWNLESIDVEEKRLLVSVTDSDGNDIPFVNLLPVATIALTIGGVAYGPFPITSARWLLDPLGGIAGRDIRYASDGTLPALSGALSLTIDGVGTANKVYGDVWSRRRDFSARDALNSTSVGLGLLPITDRRYLLRSETAGAVEEEDYIIDENGKRVRVRGKSQFGRRYTELLIREIG